MWRALVLLPAAVAIAACGPPAPSPLIASLREVGSVPNPPGAGGRDVGCSLRFGGHSVWVFGDTFFADAAADGYHWRASTWSYTDDADGSDGLSGWSHALGADGKPRALLPHTPDEQAFDDAHNGDPCPAGGDCGARHTAWPGSAVVDPSTGGALVFYSEEDTEPSGAFSFHSTGSSIATWASPDDAAVRPTLRSPDAGGDPTLLFLRDEPTWGAAALVDDGLLYAYACDGGGLTSPCRLARVPLGQALDRAAWRFFDGASWSGDWHEATNVFDGAPLLSVHFSPYFGKWLAIYLEPLGRHMVFRTGDAPEGPWSSPATIGQAAPALDGNWPYALFAHPELARDGGRTDVLSYFQPGKFLDGTIHLLTLTWR